MEENLGKINNPDPKHPNYYLNDDGLELGIDKEDFYSKIETKGVRGAPPAPAVIGKTNGGNWGCDRKEATCFQCGTVGHL